MDKTTVTKDIENNSLTIERTFAAPASRVWRAYADKEWFEKWWGPEGWETTTKEFEFTPGGKIHYCMKCVDKEQGEFYGQEAWGIMEITEIDEPNRFAAKDYFSNSEGTIDENMPSQRFEVTLIESDGNTRLVTRSLTDTTEELEQLVKMGMAEGFASQLNRLEALLAK